MFLELLHLFLLALCIGLLIASALDADEVRKGEEGCVKNVDECHAKNFCASEPLNATQLI